MKKPETHFLRSILLPIILILLFAGGWLLLWRIIGNSYKQAEKNQSYTIFTYNDAYYEECDLAVLQLYDKDITAVDKACCGSKAGTIAFADCEKTAYHLKKLEDAGKRDGILLLDFDGQYRCYELTGFAALTDRPAVSEICNAYGITSADDIAALYIADKDSNPIAEQRDSAEIQRFYDKFTALGDSVSQEEQVQIYYQAYETRFGKDTALKELAPEGTGLYPQSDEIAEQAAALWGENIRVISVELKNGLWLTNVVYAPTLKLVNVFGCYRTDGTFLQIN